MKKQVYVLVLAVLVMSGYFYAMSPLLPGGVSHMSDAQVELAVFSAMFE